MVKERSGKVPSPVGGLSRASGALGLMRARAGCVVWANNAFASMFRYDAASLVGAGQQSRRAQLRQCLGDVGFGLLRQRAFQQRQLRLADLAL